MSNDIVELTREAVVSIIDTHASIVAITGRASENIVAWDPDTEVDRPVIAYQFITAPPLAADGDTRLMLFQFSASAEDEATVHELLGLVEQVLTQTAFLSLPTPLDAFVDRSVRRGFDLDVDLRVSRATPVPA